MQLSKTVQNNKPDLYLENISRFLLIVSTSLCAFLYGNHSGFLKGDKFASAAFIKDMPFSGGGRDSYELISESYLFILLILLIVSFIHLLTEKLILKLLVFLLLCLPFFEYWFVFTTKKLAIQYNEPRFELMRQNVIFDAICFIFIFSFITIQILIMISKIKEKKIVKMTEGGGKSEL